MLSKQMLAALMAEFLGTTILAFTALTMVGADLGLGFIALGVGLVLVLFVLSVGNMSGGVLNPAIAVGLWTIGELPWQKALAYIAVQMIGAAAAFILYQYLSGSAQFNWTNQSTGFDARLFVAEIFGTAILAFGISAAIFQHLATGIKAAIIGGSLTIGVLIASVASSAILNPAVAFSAQSWDWGGYVAGPILGAVIGFNLYKWMFLTSTDSNTNTNA
jgi:glycerol uptake facilitator-like aquaporin